MAYKAGPRRASDITTGEFANARINAQSVTQHEEALEGVLELGDLQVSDVSMGDNVITLDQDPVSDGQAARKGYVDGQVSAEASARSTAVSAEEARALAAEASIQADVDQNELDGDADRAAIRSEFAAGDSTEQARALAAEAALGSRIDNVVSNTDPAALDSMTEIVAAFQAEDNNLDNAITTLASNQTGALNTESARAQAAEAAIQADVDQNELDCDSGLSAGTTDRAAIRTEMSANETARNASVEAIRAALQSDVDQNESDADAGLASASTDRGAIRSEFAAADAALLGDAAGDYDTLGKLEDKILEEAGARASADSSLQGAINAVQSDVDQNESDADAGLASATSDRGAIRGEMAANETARDASVEAIRAALQADVDQNELDADAGLASATSDRAAVRGEFAAADAGLSSEIGVERGRVDAILAGADVDLDTLVEVVAAYELADTGIISSIASLQSDVNQNETDADSAIAALQSDVNQNEADADAGLAAATSDRAAVRSEFAAADAAISASLATETSDRQAADTALQNAIDAVQSDVDQNESDADSGLASASSDRAAVRSEFAAADTAEAGARAAADAVIQADLDSFRDGMTIGEEVQAYDHTLNRIAAGYVMGSVTETKKSIPVATTWPSASPSGEADSVSFIEYGDFTQDRIKHGVYTLSPSGFGNTAMSWTSLKKYNRIQTASLGDFNGSPVTSVTLELPSLSWADGGKEIILKCDGLVGQLGQAITVNLVPASGSSTSIDGAGSFVLDDGYSAIKLVGDSTAGWMVF